ncbi:uncharacterized protein V1510DRAFT_368957 [Dipodascopsis tothii]|uniref:uncharacterized protein n=1 Tax=Dipodascopsis tothii TaxID=44089 RepID=UPI0034CD3BA0
MLVTASNLAQAHKTIALARKYPGFLYGTVGVHPCDANVFERFEHPEEYLRKLEATALAGKADGTVKAFGEIGLDNARLFLAPADVQRKYFELQLDVAERVGLPLFLHSRDCREEFERILFPRLPRLPRGGVVHSFTGTVEEMMALVEHGLYIGLNGCSLKTEENVAVARAVPLDRLLLETDAPWCELRPSHASAPYLERARQRLGDAADETLGLAPAVKKERFASGKMVKGRCEPCVIVHVAAVVAEIKDVPLADVCEAAWANSQQLFGFDDA